MEDSYKEVYFDKYCKTCQYCKNKEDESPCDECLAEPVNVYSHKPVRWKEKQIDILLKRGSQQWGSLFTFEDI